MRLSLGGFLSILLTCSVWATEVPSELTLKQAVDLALTQHAELAAASAHVSGSQSLQRQAALMPNPNLTLQSENWRFTSPPAFVPSQQVDFFAYLSQPIETGGKREHRTSVAKQDARIAELERKSLEWRLQQAVRQAFLRALLAQKQYELLAENGRTFEQITQYHRQRVEQGAMAEADLIKVRLEEERLKLAEESAALDAERARLDLLRVMGVPSPAAVRFRLVEPPPSAPADSLSMDALLSRARAGRAEILLGQAMVARARAQLHLQQAQARPDWNAVLGYKRTNGYNTLLAGVSIPLAVFNRNQGNIAASSSELERAGRMLEAALAQVDADVATALVGLRRRHAMLTQMQKGMLERAELSSRIALAAYQEGGTDLLRLLDAQRARNDVQLLYARTQIEYRLSLAELESAVGEENLPVGEELLHAD